MRTVVMASVLFACGDADTVGDSGTADSTVTIDSGVSADNPYRPCDVDAGLENNPDCPIEMSRCSRFRGCEPPCTGSGASDCPLPDATATPFCNFGSCFLECNDTDKVCPEGMTCVRGGICTWVEP